MVTLTISKAIVMVVVVIVSNSMILGDMVVDIVADGFVGF